MPTSVQGEPDTMTPKDIVKCMERYFHRYRDSLIRNYSRKNKIPLHPQVVGFIDHPFAKCGNQKFSEMAMTEKTLHVHSFYMLHPDTINRYYKRRKDGYTNPLASFKEHFDSTKAAYKNPIESVHVRFVDDDIAKAVKYSTKSIPKFSNQDDDQAEYFFMLPKARDEPRYHDD